MSKSLIKFQIGPVQEFIAQARSTRDLWSGSYLLSWLVATGIKALPTNAQLIFPNPEGQPLLDPKGLDPSATAILIPNLPNIFIAEVEGNPEEISQQISQAIEEEWKNIAEAVWAKYQQLGLNPDYKERFFAQVHRQLSIAWQATPLVGDNYREAYRTNGWHLDAVRQTRDFTAWDSSTDKDHEKDSLSGKEEAIFRGNKTTHPDTGKKGLNKEQTELVTYHNLLNKHTDHLGAVSIIKRVWHLVYLKEKHKLRTDSGQHLIRSIPAIAAGTKTHDDEVTDSPIPGGSYVAAIAFDGDSIGSWVNSDHIGSEVDLREFHSGFSRSLSRFALGKASEIVETFTQENPKKAWKGQLIYAGGDDVVCLLPSDMALEVAEELRTAFCETMKDTPSNSSTKPDASAGIAIVHIHSPLQDLIREAQLAEKRAKTVVGRPAFSMTLMKRSGEISHWGSKWGSGGIALYRAIANAMDDNKLSAKFPHRAIELLTPYLTQRSGLSKQEETLDTQTTKELIHKEFTFAATRQGSAMVAASLREPLETYLNGILTAQTNREKKNKKPSTISAPQELLTSIINLCTAVAFAHRTQAGSNKQETLSAS